MENEKKSSHDGSPYMEFTLLKKQDIYCEEKYTMRLNI